MNSFGARILRYRDVIARTGLSRTTLWRLERRGEFPLRCQLSANAVGWVESEVEEWIAARTARRMQPSASVAKPCHLVPNE